MGQGGSSPHTWGIRRLSLIHGACVRFIPTYVRHTSAAGAPGIAGAGSSPHTWGIQGMDGRRLRIVRFIPTYVGHTCRALRPPAPGSVHPHIRGAYFCTAVLSWQFLGSSPHTWGIHYTKLLFGQTNRFIPTYVGPTYSSPLSWKPYSVHPHIRGAYAAMAARIQQLERFIPTYVGHTCPGIFTGAFVAVHPHIRGAYGFEPSQTESESRFIPTYVGHTPTISQSVPPVPVHPHIRGAYADGKAGRVRSVGSSPHTWGIRCSGRRRPVPARFIPTYVGHTSTEKPGTRATTVHPHIRGAY